MGHNRMNQDLNISGVADNRKLRLNSANRSTSGLRNGSKSLTRMNSQRSMRSNVSQQSLKVLEQGWSSKFKKAKALNENPTPPLHRPFSSNREAA